MNTPSDRWLQDAEADFIASIREGLQNSQYFGMSVLELEKDLLVISKALYTANEVHGHELRDSGEPYIMHPIAVARILAEEFSTTNAQQIIDALLHDVLESGMKTDELQARFGDSVTKDVYVLSKRELWEYLNSLETPVYYAQEYVDSWMLASLRVTNQFWLKDFKTFHGAYFDQELRRRRNEDYLGNLKNLDDNQLAVKLADRIHNLRTLGHCTREKREKIIKETEKYFVEVARARHDEAYRIIERELNKLRAENEKERTSKATDRTLKTKDRISLPAEKKPGK